MGSRSAAGDFLGEDIMNQSAKKHLESNRGATVLLVDEDLAYLEFIRRMIQGSGYSVDACNSYTEGIRQLESGTFDIVVVGQGSRNFEGRCVLECATAFDRQLPVVVVARNVEMGVLSGGDAVWGLLIISRRASRDWKSPVCCKPMRSIANRGRAASGRSTQP